MSSIFWDVFWDVCQTNLEMSYSYQSRNVLFLGYRISEVY